MWTASGRSSTSFTRTRSSPRSSSSRSPGTWAKGATRWETSPSCGPSGTASIGTRSGRTGKGTQARWASSGYRLTGSSDLYGKGGRRPYASINFVTAHDGFTLHDLVSYNDKHNEANGEDQPGRLHNENLSWNGGVEGATEDLRGPDLARAAEAELPRYLLLSQGVPMLSGGGRDRPNPGREQQRVLPGQRNESVRLAAGQRAEAPAGLHAKAHRPAPGSPGVSAAAVLRRPAHLGLRGQGFVLVPNGWERDHRRELARSPRALHRTAPGRRRHRGGGRPGRADHGRHLLDPPECAPRTADVSSSRSTTGHPVENRAGHPGGGSAPPCPARPRRNGTKWRGGALPRSPEREVMNQGPRIYNLFPLLAGPLPGWRPPGACRRHGVYLDIRERVPPSRLLRSLYSVKDYYTIDARLVNGVCRLANNSRLCCGKPPGWASRS